MASAMSLRVAIRLSGRQHEGEKRRALFSPLNGERRGGRSAMNAPALITITPVCVADLLAEGERMPMYVHVVDHPVRACSSTPA